MTIDEVKRELFINSEEVCGNDMVDLYEAENCCNNSFIIGYNKAIDDFAVTFKSKTSMENILVDEIAEQLKEGGENE